MEVYIDTERTFSDQSVINLGKNNALNLSFGLLNIFVDDIVGINVSQPKVGVKSRETYPLASAT